MPEKVMLSIVMPVHNAEKYVKAAVESILSQTFCDFELICVNDASTDNSLQILNDIAKTDLRVKVLNSPENIGAGFARNAGIEAASGRYLTFVDSDDTINKDLYERVFNRYSDREFDQVVWGITEKYFSASGKLTKTRTITPGENEFVDCNSITAGVLDLEQSTLFGYQYNSIYRLQIIKENNIRFEKALIYEDFFFNLAFARHMKNFATIDYAGYNYSKRPSGSITHSFIKEYFELSYRRIEDMLNFCRERDYFDSGVGNILGNRLLRYTLSAFCRYLKPESEMDSMRRKNWFKTLSQSPLFAELMPHCKPENPAYSIIKFSVTHNLYFPAHALSKIVNLIR